MNSLRIAGQNFTASPEFTEEETRPRLSGRGGMPKQRQDQDQKRPPDSQGRAPADPFSDPVAENQIMTKLSFSKLTPEEFYSGWQPF